ncbi:MAG TPA: hypothetical protein VKV29_04935 [Chthonomonas sp.]|uniref:hypothetical protein n=1 Tax=Chthonomonas sp. TaxID=2282153 RepID=UPI002B4AF305|nr:hypothetical protein [Chthonomonas sp.]HLH79610.1 hypothetical protein [Chthonomonas sp.]
MKNTNKPLPGVGKLPVITVPAPKPPKLPKPPAPTGLGKRLASNYFKNIAK